MPARILVVEATREARALIADVLAADGHEVTSVAHGVGAVGGPRFDPILSDLTLPAIEGAQLSWEIGARWPDLASRVICVTDGHDAGAIDHPTLRAASVPFLVKPFLPEHLLDIVTRAPTRGTR